MAFESKPLRVQLQSLWPTVCRIPSIPYCPGVSAIPCMADTLPDCGPLSGVIGNPFTPEEWVVVEHDAEDPTSIVIGLDDLPTYIDALDAELKHIEVMAERKEELETRLEEARSILQEAVAQFGAKSAAEGEQAEA